MDNRGEQRLRETPELKAGLLSSATYSWISPLFKIARKRGLEQDDLFFLPSAERSKQLASRFQAGWSRRTAEEGEHNDAFYANAFKWSVWEIVRKPILIAGVYRLINTLLQVAQPLALAELLRFVEEVEERDIEEGFIWAAIIFFLSGTQALVENMFFWLVSRGGWQARTTISGAVFAKSLRLSTSSRQSMSQGQIVNLMQLDAEKVERFAFVIHVGWDALLQLFGYCAVIFFYIEEAVFVGLAVPLAFAPFQICAMILLFGFFKKFALATDERIKLTNEAMISVLAIKSAGWESQFVDRIAQVRGTELHYLRNTLFIASLGMAFVISLPTLMAVSGLVYFGLSREEGAISAAILFASVQAFNSLRFPLLQIPGALSSYVNVKVSQRRLASFLSLDEKNQEDQLPPREKDIELEIIDGDFTWGKQSRAPNSYLQDADPAAELGVEEVKKDGESSGLVLSGINVRIPSGALVGVIGTVGSGKSSLLSAFLGEIEQVKGSTHVQGSIAYSSQTAWIQNATLKDNVLFGENMDKERYSHVLKVCQLEKDLEILQDGDMTEIGERGINLSGGQAQRVSVARAAYSSSQIVLLDDPLSALDPEVGLKLFEECVLDFLSDRTRVMATNQLNLLSQCDYIIGLTSTEGQGRILFQGPYQELLDSNEDFAHVTKALQFEKKQVEEAQVEEEEEDVRAVTKVEGEALMQEEERELGAVKWKYYKGYLRAAGWCFLTLSVFLLICAQLATLLNIVALGAWANDPLYEDNPLSTYVAFYAGAAGVASFFYFLQAFSFLSSGLRVSRKFHKQLLFSVLRAPMAFFDTTPTGRVVARFARDLNSIDTELPLSLMGFVFLVGFFIGSILTIASQLPVFLLVLPPLLILYSWLMRYYRPMARDSKRLESISRSPIYQHFGETLGGLSSIRAFSKTEEFMYKCESKIDNNIRASYALKALQRWIAVRISFTSAIVVGLSSCMVVYFADRGDLDAGTAGVVITLVFGFTGIVGGLLQSFVTIETLFNSVERVHHYSYGIPQEDSFSSDDPPPPEWPSNGSLTFTDVFMRYRDNTPIVLKGISFSIPGGSSCGIVGRTGSGKSSIFLTLLRIIEVESGNIVIDGRDLRGLGLHEVRQKISMVPQSPIMFSGTIRLNLDPFGSYSDDSVWVALEQVNLAEHIRSLPDGLSAEVVEYGENFSQGQRQLICMARSLLAKAKILLLDEATSSVDFDTDALIQGAIRTHFTGCTLLTIAHRVQTISDYDNILVLDDGQVAEFGNPNDLLADTNSHFSKIVAEMGHTTS